MAPLVGLNLATDKTFITAIKPLVADGLVEALEWDIDAPWVVKRESPELPSWIDKILDLYSSNGRLFAHCVWLSMLTPHRKGRQAIWLERIAQECSQRSYRLVSEHLGFMAAGPYVINTLLPVPYVEAAVATGRERLARLAEATGTSVGLENMPGAIAPADATSQAAFLDDILAPSNGFLLLDIHNVFAQAVNLEMDPFALLDTFPCDRVKIMHVSGGRWKDVGGKPYRFDGHNGVVPPEVYPLLKAALARCPNTEMVVFERRVGSLDTETEVSQMQADYRHMFEVVKNAEHESIDAFPKATPLNCAPVVPKDAISDPRELADYEDALVEALAINAPPDSLKANLLTRRAVAPVRDYVASFRSRNLQATSLLVQRWARTEADMNEAGLVPRNRA